QRRRRLQGHRQQDETEAEVVGLRQRVQAQADVREADEADRARGEKEDADGEEDERQRVEDEGHRASPAGRRRCARAAMTGATTATGANSATTSAASMPLSRTSPASGMSTVPTAMTAIMDVPPRRMTGSHPSRGNLRRVTTVATTTFRIRMMIT